MQLHLFNFIGKPEITRKMIPISVIILFMIFGENVISPIFSVFVNSVTHNVFYTGILLSMVGFVGVVISVPVGVLADKINVKRMIQVSTAAFIVIPFLYTLFPNTLALFIIRLAGAVMTTIVWSSVWTYIYSEIDNSHKAHEISLVSKTMNFGSALSPIFGGLLAMVAFLLPFYIVSMMFLIAFFLATILLQSNKPRTIDTFGYLLKKDIILLRDLFMKYKMVILMGIVAFSVLTAISSFLPLLLEQYGFTYLQIGIIIAVSLVPIMLSETFVGDLIDRTGSIQTLAFSLILLGFVGVMMSISFHLYVLLPMMIIFGIASSIVLIAFSSILSDWSDESDRGLLSGTRKFFMSIGAAAGPFFSGAFLDFGGPKLTMAILAAASLATALLFIAKNGNLFNK